MRRGFTMIELIFVIVILGILAAVAIPRLAATRDDANIAKSLSEIGTAVADFGAYYTSQGKFGTIEEMTGVQFSEAGSTDMNANQTINYQVQENAGPADCVTFATTPDGNLTVATVGAPGSICSAVTGSDSYKKLVGQRQFGGSSVKF